MLDVQWGDQMEFGPHCLGLELGVVISGCPVVAVGAKQVGWTGHNARWNQMFRDPVRMLKYNIR